MHEQNPLWLPNFQEWAVEQERNRHDGALTFFGEYSLFVLLWTLKDFEAGRVTRCLSCYLSEGKIAEVYGQGAREKCESCFGTTFQGGYKAKIARLALWDMTEETPREHARGEILNQTASVQSTSDFRLQVGDYIFRADGTRWQVQSINAPHLRTGLFMPRAEDTPTGYNFGNVVKEDDNSVAFMIPPEDLSFLDTRSDYPPDFSAYEEVSPNAGDDFEYEYDHVGP